MDNFKRKVLDLAVNELNKNTDIKVSYEQHKKGRVITGFSFKIKEKNKDKAKKLKDVTPRDKNTLDMLSSIKMTDNQRHAFAEQIAKDLLDNDKQRVYLPFLEKVGFKI